MLADHKRFKDAVDLFRQLEEEGRRTFARMGPVRNVPLPPGLEGVTLDTLLSAVKQALADTPPESAEEEETVIHIEPVTVNEKMAEVKAKLAGGAKLRFRPLLAECKTRTEIVVLFLAILEMIKGGELWAEQDTPFGDIELVESEPAEAETADTEPADTVNVPPTAWTQTASWPAPPPPAPPVPRRPPRRRRRPFLTPLTLSVLLIGGGIASLLQATGALDVNLTVLLALATSIVGAALVTAAFAGRAHTLIIVGLLLLAATAISNTIDVPLRGGIGNRHYRPVSVSDLRSHYELGIGELQLDLRDVPLAAGTTVVDAQTGIGALEVFVPSSVRVEVHAHAGAGSLRLFGSDTGGWPDNDERTIAGSGTGVLRLDLRVGAGQIRVRRFEPNGIETILGAN
jgi:hypothetical protein